MIKYKWFFSVWRPRQQFTIGVEWCTNKHFGRSKLIELDFYLGFFAFGWIKMPVDAKKVR